MNKFKIGDRINFYQLGKCETGIITGIQSENYPNCLLVSTKSTNIWVHYKQCRKLIKKYRRRIWVNPKVLKYITRYNTISIVDQSPYWPEFIQVNKK